MVIIVNKAVATEKTGDLQTGGEDGCKGSIGREVVCRHARLADFPFETGVGGFLGSML